MSLGGIAIAIGAMVDAAIVVVEQTHKGLESWDRGGRREDHAAVIVRAVKQVAGPSFFALLVIAVSFLPVLTLEGQEGRLFKPLAYTKNFAMIIAAVLAITLDPALRLLFTRFQDFDFQPRLALPRRQRGPGRPHPAGGAAPGQPVPHAGLPAGRGVFAAARVARDRGVGRPHGRNSPGFHGPRLGVHAPARRRLAPLHADHHARASPSPRPRSCCRSRTASSAASRRCATCSGRPAAPRPRPTRRRSR